MTDDVPDLLPGFDSRSFELGEATIHARIGGAGPPLVLLHGFPQTCVTWHKIAPRLVEKFTLVLPDLRGYGRSSCPASTPDHASYSKRAMAGDVLETMRRLGHETFACVGHDRGGRVAYRLALDCPDAVSRLGIVEIVPTYEMWERATAAFAQRAYHWMFLAQPEPMPERLIGGSPTFFCDYTLASWTKAKDLSAFDPDALRHYRALFADPARIHAMCEDYRAGATCDYSADRADHEIGRRIACPVHIVHGREGFPASAGGPLDIWRGWADAVTGTELDSGHFAQEENPSATLAALLPFLRGG